MDAKRRGEPTLGRGSDPVLSAANKREVRGAGRARYTLKEILKEES